MQSLYMPFTDVEHWGYASMLGRLPAASLKRDAHLRCLTPHDRRVLLFARAGPETAGPPPVVDLLLQNGKRLIPEAATFL